MGLSELSCYLIVAAYLMWQWRRGEGGALFVRFGAVTLGAWLTENSCIHLYDFYHYSSDWLLMIDRVPFAVVVVWPVVIDSAARLARQVGGESALTPWLAGAIVFTDASLIEPVAVWSNLWQWTEPGFLSVPPIGITGWAIFAALFLQGEALLRARPAIRYGVSIVAALGGTHLALLLLWWGALRWVNLSFTSEATWAAIGLAWLIALAIALRLLRRSFGDTAGALPDLTTLLQRLPGALFFFVLLAVGDNPPAALLALVGAIALPYLVMTGLAWRQAAV